MKILIITQYFWPEAFRINDLAEGLNARGHAVSVLTGHPNYPQGTWFAGFGPHRGWRDWFGPIPVARVPLVPRGSGGGLRLALNFLSFALSASLFGPWLCREPYDVIFVFGPSPVTVGLPALALKALRRIPVVFWVQDLWPETLAAIGRVRSALALGMVRRLVRFIYRGCDRILISSQAFHTPVAKLAPGSARIDYYPQCAEACFRPAKPPPEAPERALVPAGFVILFAGNLGEAQGLEIILGAAERLRDLPDIQWVLVGDGRCRDWVEREVARRRLGGCVRLLGRHPVEAMPRFFALAEVLLVTLRNDPLFALSLPAKIQSYLACAKPIVAAVQGEGARVLAESGAGLVCAPGDDAALAEAVLRLQAMPTEARGEMGARGLAFHRAKFERGRLLEQLEQMLSEAVP